MSPIGVYLALGVSVIADLAGIGILLWWIGNRRRLSEETVGRAEEHARHLRQQAERDAESLKKEALLEAREKSHALLADADRQARLRQQEIVGLEQALADRTRALADRMATTEKLERELRARDATLADLRQRTEAAATRSEQLVADRHHELQRVAGLSAEEARELLLKQI